MAGRDDLHRSAAVLMPGELLGLGLDERCEEFERLLLAPPLDGIRPEGHAWLRQRYEQIVPAVLPAALAAVEHGTPIDPDCLERLRALAAESAGDTRVDVSVALRGAVPALRVFTLVMRTAALEHPSRTMLAMGRASLVAHELGTCWFEAWAQGRRAATSPRAATGPAATGPGAARPAPEAGADAGAPADVDPDSLELVAVAPGLEDTERQILELAAEGLSNDEIGRRTAYSRQAVAWHLGRLMKRWGVRNRTAMVAVGFARGWIRPRRARPDAPERADAS